MCQNCCVAIVIAKPGPIKYSWRLSTWTRNESNLLQHWDNLYTLAPDYPQRGRVCHWVSLLGPPLSSEEEPNQWDSVPSTEQWQDWKHEDHSSIRLKDLILVNSWPFLNANKIIYKRVFLCYRDFSTSQTTHANAHQPVCIDFSEELQFQHFDNVYELCWVGWAALAPGCAWK